MPVTKTPPSALIKIRPMGGLDGIRAIPTVLPVERRAPKKKEPGPGGRRQPKPKPQARPPRLGPDPHNPPGGVIEGEWGRGEPDPAGREPAPRIPRSRRQPRPGETEPRQKPPTPDPKAPGPFPHVPWARDVVWPIPTIWGGPGPGGQVKVPKGTAGIPTPLRHRRGGARGFDPSQPLPGFKDATWQPPPKGPPKPRITGGAPMPAPGKPRPSPSGIIKRAKPAPTRK